MVRVPRKAQPPPADPGEIQRALAAWYESPLGHQFLSQARVQLDAILPYLFGYHLLQVGWIGEADLLKSSRISHRMLLDSEQKVVSGRVRAPARLVGGVPEAFPVASDSIDVVLLAHTLDFSPEPHEVLREAERSLIPEGHLVVLGFNPWSLWILRRVFRWRRQELPWSARFLSVTRLKDWLALLGFDVVTVRHFFYRPPLQRRGFMKRLKILERFGARYWPVFGAGYVVVARKRVLTMTPVRPRWRSRRRLAAAGLAGSSHRTTHD